MNWRRLAYCSMLKLKRFRLNRLEGHGLSADQEQQLLSLLNRHRCIGGCYRLFDGDSSIASYAFGEIGQGRPAAMDSVYRIASLSKMLTALCCMKLVEQGRLQLDQDVNEILPFELRHPDPMARPITLRMLLQHSAGIRDSKAYAQALTGAVDASSLLDGDCFTDHLPGQAWHYSNFGFGLIGSLLEARFGLSFEQIMQQELFQPLGIKATFYPQLVRGELADAIRLLPREHVAFDAAERKARPLKDHDVPLPERHYSLAQGNCCVDAPGLELMTQQLLTPGYLSAETLQAMRSDLLPFGRRSAKLSQGLGLFRMEDSSLSRQPIYGHQGKAYGAVHGVYFEPLSGRGFVLLTTGASEAYREFLTDLTEELIQFSFEAHA